MSRTLENRNSLTLRPDVFTSSSGRTSRLLRNLLTLRPDVVKSSIGRTSRMRRNSLTLRPDVFTSSIDRRPYFKHLSVIATRRHFSPLWLPYTTRYRCIADVTPGVVVILLASRRDYKLYMCECCLIVEYATLSRL